MGITPSFYTPQGNVGAEAAAYALVFVNNIFIRAALMLDPADSAAVELTFGF